MAAGCALNTSLSHFKPLDVEAGTVVNALAKLWAEVLRCSVREGAVAAQDVASLTAHSNFDAFDAAENE